MFFHLTYEGAVQWDGLADARERSAVEAQISSFGQCPSQLFTKAHPARLSLDGSLAARFPRAHDGARRTSRRCVRRSIVALHSARSAVVHCAFVGPASRHVCVSIDRGGGVGVMHYVDDRAADGGGGAGGAKEETMMPLALEPLSSTALRLLETDADALLSAPAAVATLALEPATRAAVWLAAAAAAPPPGTTQTRRPPKLKALAKVLFAVSAGHWDGGVRLSRIDVGSSAVRTQLSLVAPLDSRTTASLAIFYAPLWCVLFYTPSCVLREPCSQFDSLPLTSLTISPGRCAASRRRRARARRPRRPRGRP